jgi:hypothetical protein
MWFREENCLQLLNTKLFIFKEFNNVYFLYVDQPVNYKNFIDGLSKSKIAAHTEDASNNAISFLSCLSEALRKHSVVFMFTPCNKSI